MRQMKDAADKSGLLSKELMLALMTLVLASHVPGISAAEPSELKIALRSAFERYVHLIDARNQTELKRGTDLLWIDELPAPEKKDAYEALKRGEVKMKRVDPDADGKGFRATGGMIHHWVGVVFVPSAKVPDVLGVLQDYNQHAVYYAPDVQQSKLEWRDGDRFRAFLRFRRHKLVTVVLNTEHEVQYFHDGPGRAHSRSSAVRIAEVENAGKSDEHEKTPGDDNGFLWGMETWWRMEEADGGVYVQSEVVSLTRNIPTGLGWMIGPFVTSIPRESLTFTLLATRKAVEEPIHRDSAANGFLFFPHGYIIQVSNFILVLRTI